MTTTSPPTSTTPTPTPIRSSSSPASLGGDVPGHSPRRRRPLWFAFPRLAGGAGYCYRSLTMAGVGFRLEPAPGHAFRELPR